MGRVEFTQENKKQTVNYEYPKLKLTQGEKARIVVGLEAPVMEYVHTLRAPQIVNGIPQTKKEKARGRNAGEVTTHVLDFLTKALCMGDATVLAEKGVDPRNCPMCALAVENADYTAPPQRRYAMHVMRYRTKGNSADVATPFSVELLVWSFTDKIFNKLVDIRNDIESGDLRRHDLVLGPCTNADFQQFDITPSLKKAEWMADQKRAATFKETWEENQIPDLTVAIGNAKKREWIEQDIETIREAWAEVRAYESGDDSGGLDEADLSKLLDSDEAPKTDDDGWAVPDEAEDSTEEETDEETSEDVDDLLASMSADEPEEAPKPAAKKRAATTRKPAAKKVEEEPEEEAADSEETEVNNFDDLLAEMS